MRENLDKKGIIPACELPWYEEVWLKKDVFGWRIVNPVKDENGKIIWINFFFGGKRNLIFLLIILLIFGMYGLGTYELTKSMKDVVENPCDYCTPDLDFNVNSGLNIIENVFEEG